VSGHSEQSKLTLVATAETRYVSNQKELEEWWRVRMCVFENSKKDQNKQQDREKMKEKHAQRARETVRMGERNRKGRVLMIKPD